MAESTYPTIGHGQICAYLFPVKSTVIPTMANAQLDRLQTLGVGPIDLSFTKMYELGRKVAITQLPSSSVEKPASFEWRDFGSMRPWNLLLGQAYSNTSEITETSYDATACESMLLIHKLDATRTNVIESMVLWRLVPESIGISVPASKDDFVTCSARMTGEGYVWAANTAGKAHVDGMVAVSEVIGVDTYYRVRLPEPLIVERDDWADNVNQISTLIDANIVAGDTTITITPPGSQAGVTDGVVDFESSGSTNTGAKWALTFTTPAGCSGPLRSVTVEMIRVGAAVGQVYASIYTDDAGGPPTAPSAQTGSTSFAVAIDSVDTSAEDITFYFKGDNKPVLAASTKYWVVLSTTGYSYTNASIELSLRTEAAGGLNVVHSGTTAEVWTTGLTHLGEMKVRWDFQAGQLIHINDDADDWETARIASVSLVADTITVEDKIINGYTTAGADTVATTPGFMICCHNGTDDIWMEEGVDYRVVARTGAPDTIDLFGKSTKIFTGEVIWASYLTASGAMEWVNNDADPAGIKPTQMKFQFASQSDFSDAVEILRLQGMDIAFSLTRTAQYEMGNPEAFDKTTDEYDMKGTLPMLESDITTIAELKGKTPATVKVVNAEQAPEGYGRLITYETDDRLEPLLVYELPQVKLQSSEFGANANERATKRMTLSGDQFHIRTTLA